MENTTDRLLDKGKRHADMKTHSTNSNSLWILWRVSNSNRRAIRVLRSSSKIPDPEIVQLNEEGTQAKDLELPNQDSNDNDSLNSLDLFVQGVETILNRDSSANFIFDYSKQLFNHPRLSFFLHTPQPAKSDLSPSLSQPVGLFALA
jgi:hypothetical protein